MSREARVSDKERRMYLQPLWDSSNVTSADDESEHSVLVYDCVQSPLPDGQVNAILAAPEGSKLEFKRVSGKMVSKALETLSAFANSDGGTLVLGIADPSFGTGRDRIYGIEENLEAVDELRRKLTTQFDHPDLPVQWRRVLVTGAGGAHVHVLILHVDRSEHVHSIVGDGTWTRLGASNCQMTARQIIELSYRRGDQTAESEPMAVNFALLDTPTWRTYANARGLVSGGIADQLERVSLAERRGDIVQPRRAAVLLFADEPGGHLGAVGSRCEVRMLVYSGTRIETRQIPNLRKTPRAFRGPLIHLIDSAVRAVADELAEGLTLASSGFETRHRIPLRIVKEAIVNAVIHRDYRLNRDIFVRVFDNRIEIESPGALPGTITTANIRTCSSKARNALIARALFEFPMRPNIDAGEGVRMMFSEMERAGLYPPQYRESSGAAGDSITLVLLSDPRPALWDLVSDWIDRNGPIGNRVVCRLGKLDTFKASRALKQWMELGLLQGLEGRSRRDTRYGKIATTVESDRSFAFVFANETPQRK